MTAKKSRDYARKPVGACAFCGEVAHYRTKMGPLLLRELRELGKDPDELERAANKGRERDRGTDGLYVLPVCSKHYSRIIRSGRRSHHLRWTPTIPPEDLPQIRKDVKSGKRTIADICRFYGVARTTLYARLALDYQVED